MILKPFLPLGLGFAPLGPFWVTGGEGVRDQPGCIKIDSVDLQKPL